MAYREFQNEATYLPIGAMDLAPLERAKAQEGVNQKTQLAARQAAKVKPIYPDALKDVPEIDKPFVNELRQKAERGFMQKKQLGIPFDEQDYANASEYQTAAAQAERDKALYEQQKAIVEKDPYISSKALPYLQTEYQKGHGKRNIQPTIDDISNNPYKFIDENTLYQKYGQGVEDRDVKVTKPINGGEITTVVKGKFINPKSGGFGITNDQYNAFLQSYNGNAGKYVTYQAANELLGKKGEYTLPNGTTAKSEEDIVRYGQAFPDALPQLDQTRRKIVSNKLESFYGASKSNDKNLDPIRAENERKDYERVTVATTSNPVTRTASYNNDKGSYVFEWSSNVMGVEISKDGKALPVTTTIKGFTPLNNANISEEQRKKLQQNTVNFDVKRVVSMPALDGKRIALLGLNPAEINLNTPEEYRATVKQIAEALNGEVSRREGEGKSATQKKIKLTADMLRKMEVKQYAVGQTNTQDVNAKSGFDGEDKENIEGLVPIQDNPSLLPTLYSSINSKKATAEFIRQNKLMYKAMQDGINMAISSRIVGRFNKTEKKAEAPKETEYQKYTKDKK
jgi:hypothetical protein